MFSFSSRNGLMGPISLAIAAATVRRRAPRALSVASAAANGTSFDLDAATAEMARAGFVHVPLGAGVTPSAAEDVARALMRLAPSGGGSYNGGGGVTRDAIGDSNFLNAGAGAPAELRIQFHNEMAYSRAFPRFVTFAMFAQARTDGTTLLVDNVRVTRALSPALAGKMRALGVQYVRLLHDDAHAADPDFYAAWQGAFQTRDEAEAMARANAAPDGFMTRHDAKRLRQVSWSPVFVTHPEHGELYFSSILNRHASWLDGHAVWGAMPHRERPYQCVWGDGSELSDGELAELRDAHDGNMEKLRLEQGDLVVMDNLRVAHGRTSYTPGPDPRLIGLLLSDMVDRELARSQPPAAFGRIRAAALEA